MRIPTTPPAPGLPFFVYGTLRPGEVNHGLFLRGRTLREEPALLTGAVLYDGPGYPYAVEEPGGTVAGTLVTARPEAYARLLAELDRLEEYRPGDPYSLYERVVCEVTVSSATSNSGTGTGTGTGTDAPVPAWVYLAAPAVAAGLRADGNRIGGGDWLAHR
ncbi:gamma-glutamylcyclotransferase family protein [Streptomyces antibioticus]|uniref:gamma-glutamylcyclotransferase family protein n=1 Tax=Streptomyces antibioticus TaxID=1890 RepID=UPI002255FAAA|nr:gamma-glutamylcyclotransferase family protein [Streptomyces antibioticus]MCX4739338.1 gamma-glutamylcyclotransferase [Streptomyces antibioticus]